MLGLSLATTIALVRRLDVPHLEGTGLTADPLCVQDLAFWLPLAGLVAVLLRQRAPWGYVLGAALLCMWLIESVGVAVDQWLGSQADPTSPVATTGGSAPFAALAVISLVPTWLMLGRLSPSPTWAQPTTWCEQGSSARCSPWCRRCPAERTRSWRRSG